MGDKITVTLEARTLHGKKTNSLRRQGLVPMNMYGEGMQPTTLQLGEVETAKLVQAAGRHTPVHVKVGSKTHLAMIKDVEYDRVRHSINHVSFQAINQNDPVVTEVAIRLTGMGESEAERAGLVVLQSLDRIEIKALPKDLPEALEISIVSLREEGEKLLVSDIELPSGVEIMLREDGRAEDDDEEEHSVLDQVVASVYEPAALQAANEAAGGSAESIDDVEVEDAAPADEAKK